MARYHNPTGIEGEYEPGSRKKVLRNLLNIRSASAMHEAEYLALAQAQEDYLNKIQNSTVFTAALICDMHRAWLGRIYPWAGKYRQVEMAKGEFRWPPAMRVAPNMTTLESGLLRQCTPCPPGPVKDVVDRVARVHAELLLIHPFREGNGRLARWVATLMFAQADLPAPRYGLEGIGSRQQRKRYLHAVVQGYAQNYDALRDFFGEAVERRLRGTL